jgi:hypothetical protein
MTKREKNDLLLLAGCVGFVHLTSKLFRGKAAPPPPSFFWTDETIVRQPPVPVGNKYGIVSITTGRIGGG